MPDMIMPEGVTYDVDGEQYGDAHISTESISSFREPLPPMLASPAVAASLRLVTAENPPQQPLSGFAAPTSEVIPLPPRKDPPPEKKEQPEKKAA